MDVHSHRRRLLIAILVLSVLAPPSLALGQLVVLPTSGKSLGAVTAPEPGKWIVLGPSSLKFIQPRVLDGGRACFFEGAPGEYAVIFLPPAADAQPLVVNVVLGGSAPYPDPPGPQPPTPDDLVGFSKTVCDWATTLVPTSPRKKCQSLAQSFANVAAQIAAGRLTDPPAIITSTYALNQTVLTADERKEWLPFIEKLRTYCNAESEAGRLVTLEQHRILWEAIAAGLRGVR